MEDTAGTARKPVGIVREVLPVIMSAEVAHSVKETSRHLYVKTAVMVSIPATAPRRAALTVRALRVTRTADTARAKRDGSHPTVDRLALMVPTDKTVQRVAARTVMTCVTSPQGTARANRDGSFPCVRKRRKALWDPSLAPLLGALLFLASSCSYPSYSV